ncbi:hypothetical protein CO115_00155 [Candidatus Falkowbacteria bacterium CG_4_9_14_3_um_filter_36_9]|uniref:PDZ domain-containing protein n=1 Tax=Candidatus Falkowbacteria bacterium CG02_land_8_20_14_3_00_36_14 TaxID=1974560 RepID=A0A2M7DNL1_9BACT|nr:MAG: hypothetical protein COS18_02910 [Candidatus Falkowbacteria bacterium CG02_land_8_20_14_3_00_36_14]PIX11931.1 MAG: hypothetical protein COZ73_01545 [Candidatus Falkowbacteria bacterium CG_4_8_14_3_um_filter_36_11]PJA11167.1 MAG: hypothetical protein COX67_01255 [Candidatus Falkowbacteria bacterium CG_4_10_14_0_2_um_filter_36_22]PJB20833.1 MAG: hypothetical protein CO115_00155 [Candidatus Falkowbacteria bacterium CG_4_9_14_3_um_filter_36_9]
MPFKIKDKLNRIKPLFIIMIIFFSLAGGMAGDLILKNYFWPDIYNPSFNSEIDLSSGYYGNSSLVIREAKKVIVEQNDKVIETINTAKSSLVGIYEKKNFTNPSSAVSDNKFNLNNYYDLKKPIAEGIIITSDGWILTGFNIADLNKYVIITGDGKINSIDKIINDGLTKVYFLHINAKDLPIKVFGALDETKNGQLAIAVNWKSQAYLTSIINSHLNEENIVSNSDLILRKINLANVLGKEFNSSVLFGISGNIIGLVNELGEVDSMTNFTSAINSLLKYKEIRRASLGINYIDLSQLINAKENNTENNYANKGALIYKDKNGIAVVKNSPARTAGLKEDDIITYVNNIEINKDNNLADIMQNYLEGEKIKITYMRNNQEKETEVILGKLIVK